MSIDKDLPDRLVEGGSPGDPFGRTGMASELTRGLAQRAPGAGMDVYLDGGD